MKEITEINNGRGKHKINYSLLNFERLIRKYFMLGQGSGQCAGQTRNTVSRGADAEAASEQWK
jgi:hypothetical protein